MNSFPIVISKSAVFPLPDTPTFRRNFRNALVICEKLQKIIEVFEAFRAVPTRASLGLHGAVVLPSLFEDGNGRFLMHDSGDG